MSIKSFLAYPAPGKKDELDQLLNRTPYCEEVISSTNEELIILVIDAPDKESEEQLIGMIESAPSCNQLSMVAGYDNTNFKSR